MFDSNSALASIPVLLATALAIFLRVLPVLDSKWAFSSAQRKQRRRLEDSVQSETLPQVPGNRLLMLLTSLFQSRTQFEDSRKSHHFVRLFEQFGNTFSMVGYNGANLIFTNDFDNVQSAWEIDFDSWCLEEARLFSFKPFIGPGIITTSAQKSKYGRKLLVPLFKSSLNADLHKWAQLTNTLIRSLPKDGSSFDLHPYLVALGHDGTASLLFGMPLGFVDSLRNPGNGSNQDAMDAFTRCAYMASRRLEMPQNNFFTWDLRFWRDCRIVHKWMDGIIRQRLAQPGPRQLNFLDQLIARGHDISFIRHQLLNVFLAARDSVREKVSNMIFHLSRHPDVWARLRQEVLDSGIMLETDMKVLKGKLDQLQYLDIVLRETSRLQPSLGFNSRSAVRDTLLPTGGGALGSSPVLVRKGDTLIVNHAALQTRKDVWGADADKFRPDRWLEARQLHPWAFKPFGGGPRVCPGYRTGMSQAKYTIAALTTAIERIECRDYNSDYQELYQLITTSKNGVQVSIVPDDRGLLI